MGRDIAWQIGKTPGMELVSVTDKDIHTAIQAVHAYGAEPVRIDENHVLPVKGHVAVTTDPFFLLNPDSGFKIDVLVEATNTVTFAGWLCLEAIEKGIHVVLMNAEIDLAMGLLMHDRAVKKGVIVTSDAGDQHGVLMRMIEEIQMWNFRIVMAGNIKGFLDRYATAKSVAEEARERNGNYYELGVHLFHGFDGEILEDVRSLMGERLIPIELRVLIRYGQGFRKYPLGFMDLLTGIPPSEWIIQVAGDLLHFNSAGHGSDPLS